MPSNLPCDRGDAAAKGNPLEDSRLPLVNQKKQGRRWTWFVPRQTVQGEGASLRTEQPILQMRSENMGPKLTYSRKGMANLVKGLRRKPMSPTEFEPSRGRTTTIPSDGS
jgi:hypothetical protein